jgi:serine/threonine protein kinase
MDKRAILVDFGLARTIENGMSAGKTAIGTVGYSPPEQYEGRQKPQSDIYALGATLHHLLTGKFPEIPFILILKKLNQDFHTYGIGGNEWPLS